MRKSPMKFGALVAQAQDNSRRGDPLIREVADQLFDEPFSRYARKKNRFHRFVFLTAAVSTACAAVIIFFTLAAPVPLSITLDGTTVQHPTGMFIEVQANESKPLQFSDGSKVVLGASTGVRIVETSENGAAVLIEWGTAEVTVVHRDNTKWRFEVGPFTVRVTGTAFLVSWKPDEGFFSVTMNEGRIEVEGPSLSSTRAVVAGETLNAWTRSHKVVHVSNDDEKAAPSLRAKSATHVDSPPPRSAPTKNPSPTDERSRRHFPNAPMRQDSPAPSPADTEPAIAPQVISIAPEPSGEAGLNEHSFVDKRINKRIAPILSVPMGLGPKDLLKQGAEQRAAGDFDEAKHTYTMIRSGFPGTQAAAGAAFSLGRIAYDVDKDYAAAVDWFQTFLTENHGRGLVREAWGRLMESYAKADRHTDAVATAKRYLTLYPDGPHAPLARSIIDK